MIGPLTLRHDAIHDEHGVILSPTEALNAYEADATTREIRIEIGIDPLTRTAYTLTTREAAHLANWILTKLTE